MTRTAIYHICREVEWRRAEVSGTYTGSSQDLADGFIHFSTRAQLRKSAAKHRAGQTDLVLLTCDPAFFGDALKWESARQGQLFPHLYGDLNLDAVISCDHLPLSPDGVHIFPKHIPHE